MSGLRPGRPMVALVGLLGILIGEQIPPLIHHALDEEPRGGGLEQSDQAACVRPPSRKAIRSRKEPDDGPLRHPTSSCTGACSRPWTGPIPPASAVAQICRTAASPRSAASRTSFRWQGIRQRGSSISRAACVLPRARSTTICTSASRRAGTSIWNCGWDGVRSLSDAMSMLKRQGRHHPAPFTVELGWWAASPQHQVHREAFADHRGAERPLRRTHRSFFSISMTAPF